MKKILIALLVVVVAVASCIALIGCKDTVKKVKVIEIPLTSEEYAFAVAKTNTDLKNQVNQIMSEMKEDGTFQAVLDKYFANGTPAPVESAPEGTANALIVATNAAFPPFEYKEGNKFVGVDMELAKLIADKLGKPLVIKDMEFDSVILSVANGDSHLGMAGMTITDKRKETVDFCNPYYNASQMLIVPEDDKTFDGLTTAAQIEEKLKSLSGVTIGVQRGTTGNYYVKGDADWGFDGFANVTCKEYDNGGLAVKDIQNGNCTYVIIDEMPAKLIVASANK